MGRRPWGAGLLAHLGFTPLFPEGLGPGTRGENHREGREEGAALPPSVNPRARTAFWVGPEVFLVGGSGTFPVGRDLRNRDTLGSEGW